MRSQLPSFIKYDGQHLREFWYVSLKVSFLEHVCCSSAVSDCCFSITKLQDFLKASPVAPVVITSEFYVYRSTFEGAVRDSETPLVLWMFGIRIVFYIIPKHQQSLWYWPTYRLRAVIIWYYLFLVKKLPRMCLSIIASRIIRPWQCFQQYRLVCGCEIFYADLHCDETGTDTATGSSFSVISKTGVTCAFKFGARNKLFTRLRPALISCSLVMVHGVLTFNETEMSTRYVGFL